MSKIKKKKSPPKSAVGPILFGLTILLVVFGFLGGWMYYAPLASSSVAIGTVSADLEKKTVQHLEGGIVEKLLVKDGDVVKKGDTLLKLGNAKVKGKFKMDNQQYLEGLAMEARLKAQRDDMPSISFPIALTNESYKPNIGELISGQEEMFEARKRIVSSEERITQEKISQLMKQKEGIQHMIDSKSMRLSSVEEELVEWQELYEQQMIDKLKLRDVSREKISIEGNIASAQSQLNEIDVKISELEATNIYKEKEFQESVLSDLVQVQAKISNLKSMMSIGKDTLKQTTIKAPISGTIIGMKIHTVGGIIARGTPILEIIPEDSKLIVIAQVQTIDIDKVHKGLLCHIRFSAFDTKNTDVLEGIVMQVSADSILADNGMPPYYEAKIELTKQGRIDLKSYAFKLVAGMPAEVMIQLEERTVFEYMIKPLKDMFSRAFNEE